MKREIKLSKQMKYVLAGGALLIVIAVGFMLMSASHSKASAAPPVTPTPVPPSGSPSPTTTTTAGHDRAAELQLLPNLPPAVRNALEAHEVVVAVVYGAGDGRAVAPARKGARAARVGFAALDVQKEWIAQAVELFAPATADPTVLVIHRPGTITTMLPGYSDADTVAQAAAQTTPPPVVATTTTTGAAPAPAPAPAG